MKKDVKSKGHNLDDTFSITMELERPLLYDELRNEVYIQEENEKSRKIKNNILKLILGFLIIYYFFFKLFYFINLKVYGKNMNYCYDSLQTELLKKLVQVDDNFVKNISKGKILNSINSDVMDIGDMCDQVSELFTNIIQIIIVCIIVSTYNKLFFVIFLLYSILYIGLKNFFDRKSSIYLRKQKHEVDRYSSLFSQILSGLQEIKTFNMLPKLKSKLNEIKNKYSDSYINKRKYLTIRDNDIKIITYFFKVSLYIILF